jgi:hypothetical protein
VRQLAVGGPPRALELQTGKCDVAVTGGCDTFNDIFMYMCFSKTPALSPSGTRSRSTRTATAPSWAKVWAWWC